MQRDMIGIHQYPFCYVIEHYGVPARLGRIIIHRGRQGVIAADRGNYIGVNFDDDKAGVIHNVHPTDEVSYLGIGEIRKTKPPTRAQRRYQEFLRADWYSGSFADWLGIKESA